jgi:hypothetical protein
MNPYLFYAVFHAIFNHFYVFRLPKSNNTADGLFLNHAIPLWLHQIYQGSCGEICSVNQLLRNILNLKEVGR